MLEKLQKHLRAFTRDYWQRDSRPGRSVPLSREMLINSGIVAVVCGGVGLAFPAIAPVLCLFGVSTLPCMLGIRMFEIKKEMNKITTAELKLCGLDAPTATLSGPPRAINIVMNTQAIIDKRLKPLSGMQPTGKLLDDLTPHFNDCAEAAAQLEATVDGKPVDSIALGRAYRACDEYLDEHFWREEVKPLLTRTGVAKKIKADWLAAANTAISQLTEGLSQSLTVKPIRLKPVKAQPCKRWVKA
ncbi:MAG: hypothetical protein ACAH80_11530 [Alphaproteobacteria bacterium]